MLHHVRADPDHKRHLAAGTAKERIQAVSTVLGWRVSSPTEAISPENLLGVPVGHPPGTQLGLRTVGGHLEAAVYLPRSNCYTACSIKSVQEGALQEASSLV